MINETPHGAVEFPVSLLRGGNRETLEPPEETTEETDTKLLELKAYCREALAKNERNQWETRGKLAAENRETLDAEIEPKSFLEETLTSLASDDALELLPDDHRWLKAILYGVADENVSDFLNRYKSAWLDAMQRIKLPHQRQNAGRFAANTWIRRKLSSRGGNHE